MATAPAGFGNVRAALRFVFRRVVAIYFRDVEIAGVVPAKDTGGRIFAANHVNALVDPILVLTQAPCPISPVAKSTLWNIPGLSWLLDAGHAVPVVRKRDDPTKKQDDNEKLFDRVGAHLAAGGNILIFPEGTSHSEPHLITLRTGAGRMLAHARALGARGLTFQAVALEFDDREVFRSRTLLLFGPVRAVDDVAMRASDDALAQAITDVIRDDLSALLVEGATWDERLLVARAASMFANDDVASPLARSLEQQNELGRRIKEARRLLAESEPARVSALEARVAAYFRALDDEDMTDAVVARACAREPDASRDDARMVRAAGMVVTLPIALVGMVLYWLPYQVPRAVTKRLHADADVTSTYKLGIGLLVHPLWAVMLTTLAFVELVPPLAWLATVVVVTSPFAALPWLDRLDRMAGRFAALGSHEERRQRLRVLAGERTALMKELETARDLVFG